MIRVLVVDDSAAFLAAATEVILASEAFELEGIAATGEEGLELARLRRPDLALIDLHMPGIDGQETAARMAVESPETVPLLMTATPTTMKPSDELLDKRKLSATTLAQIWEQARTPTGAKS